LVQFPFRLERLLLYFVAPLLPFFLAGAALSMIFQLHRDIAPTLYFADLVGASLGAMIVTFLLQTFGGETSLILVTAAPFLAAAFLSRRYRIIAASAAVIALVVAIGNQRIGFFRVVPGTLKAMQRHMEEIPGTHVTQTGWNAYSRIDAVEGF